jgi:acetyl esterase/lipase
VREVEYGAVWGAMSSSPNINPDFAALLPRIRDDFEHLWNLPVPEMKKAVKETPRALISSIPDLSLINVTKENIKAADGATLELQIYTPRSKFSTQILPLYFIMHGGGWVVGGHGSEEALTRLGCVENQCVVVSVDYRM